MSRVAQYLALARLFQALELQIRYGPIGPTNLTDGTGVSLFDRWWELSEAAGRKQLSHLSDISRHQHTAQLALLWPPPSSLREKMSVVGLGYKCSIYTLFEDSQAGF